MGAMREEPGGGRIPGRAIGAPGPADDAHDTCAGRAVNLRADVRRVKRLSENRRVAVKMVAGQAFRALVFLVVAVALVWTGHPFLAVLPGLPFLYYLLRTFLFSRAPILADPATIYEKGLLVGGVVVKEAPDLQVAVMAGMGMEENPEHPCWGVRRIGFKTLPGHAGKTGERIPFAALFVTPEQGGEKDGVWSNFEPYLLSWAVEPASLLREAIEAIPETEWAKLEALAPRVAKKRDFGYRPLFFNDDLSERASMNPRGLPKK